MSGVLQRNISESVPKQISGILLDRINSGEYAAGKSLPSVRTLTREFAVSPVTIMRSLDILEEAGLVLRNQGKGVFVAPGLKCSTSRRIAFCFPPENFDPETVGAECWVLASEFYRGLLAGAAEEKAEVSFLQFPDECNEEEKKHYLEKLAGFDVVIRTFNLCPELFSEVEKSRITLTLGVDPAKEPLIKNAISYDRRQAVAEAAAYALSSGAATAGAIAFSEDVISGKERARNFLALCVEAGIEVETENYYMMPHRGNWRESLRKYISGCKVLPQIIYCDEQSIVPELYSAAREYGFEPGRDFKVIAICTGATLINLEPAPAYVRIPRYEMGYGVVRMVLEALKEKRDFTIPLFPAYLVTRQ